MIIFNQFFITVIMQVTWLFLRNTQFLLCIYDTFNSVTSKPPHTTLPLRDTNISSNWSTN